MSESQSPAPEAPTSLDPEATIRAGLRSPEWREWFIAASLSDSPPAMTTATTIPFREWFVSRLDTELALAVAYGLDEDKALARAATINRLAKRWGVTGMPPEVNRAADEYLAALVGHTRRGDAREESADPTDLATLVPWVADVECERCGSPLARAAAEEFDLVKDDTGTPLHFNVTAVQYLPEPERAAGVLSWRCPRCRDARHVAERTALRIIRQRWLKRSRSLTTDTPIRHTVIKATADTPGHVREP